MKSDLNFEFIRVDLSVSIYVFDLFVIKPEDGQEDADFRREVDLN